uniref:Sushi domain-containing protein n=1 Tax=Callorhinchus milii TaxID=7868 RepID=A0A4W3IL74_CALMI
MSSFTPNDGSHCITVDCGLPPNIQNTGWHLPDNTTYGSTAVYRCEIGYGAVSGNDTSVCSARGQWEGASLQCKAVDCGSPPGVPNTEWYPQHDTVYGSKAVYRCKDGYVLFKGEVTSICSARGQWEGANLQCTEVDCGSPPAIPNTKRYHTGNTTYGSTAVYKCEIGYMAVSGNDTSVCSARGQWKGASLQCTAVDCGSPPAVPKTGWYLLGNTTYGNTAVYRCEIGYVAVSGNDTSICSARGQWEGASLQCTEVDCGSPPAIPNTKRYHTGNTTYGSTAVYKCEIGYMAVSGNDTSVCSARGQWKGASLQCTGLCTRIFLTYALNW